MKINNTEITTRYARVRPHESGILVDITLDAVTTLSILETPRDIKDILYIRETPATRYMNQDIVKAFWDEVQRVTAEHIDKAR